jgi:hypothetical protein
MRWNRLINFHFQTHIMENSMNVSSYQHKLWIGMYLSHDNILFPSVSKLKITFSYLCIPGCVVCIINSIQLTLKLDTRKVCKYLSRGIKYMKLLQKGKYIVYITKLWRSWMQLWSLLYTFPHWCQWSIGHDWPYYCHRKRGKESL